MVLTANEGWNYSNMSKNTLFNILQQYIPTNETNRSIDVDWTIEAVANNKLLQLYGIIQWLQSDNIMQWLAILNDNFKRGKRSSTVKW